MKSPVGSMLLSAVGSFVGSMKLPIPGAYFGLLSGKLFMKSPVKAEPNGSSALVFCMTGGFEETPPKSNASAGGYWGAAGLDSNVPKSSNEGF